MPSLRKAAYSLLMALNRPAIRELNFMRRSQWLPADRVQAIQQQRLEQMLLYAYRHVPYYTRLFDETGLVRSGRVQMDRFGALPTLDKTLIRANFRALTSDRASVLKTHENRTGGSTGEPLRFLQDRDGVRIAGGAVLRLFYEWHGLKAGDREIKLWGSEADLFYRSRFTLTSLLEWMSGVKMLNAFRMNPEQMCQYIDTINRYRPRILRGYSSNLFELACFAEENGVIVGPPAVVISSAATLFPEMRQKIASVFGAAVYNHYGSRELHNVAMECPTGQGLHLSAFTHLVEVLDDHGRPCPPGVEGDLVITALFNQAMPFIRYRIGDRGSLAEGTCSCGRGLPLLATLSGRRIECFRTREGQIVTGHYFGYLLSTHLRDNPIAKYQIIQKDYDHLHFKLVLHPGRQLAAGIRQEIVEKTNLVMGEGCHSTFEIVDDIPLTSSGKHQYTHCRIPTFSQPGVPPSEA